MTHYVLVKYINIGELRQNCTHSVASYYQFKWWLGAYSPLIQREAMINLNQC